METMTVALAGNPNVGKSSIFNALTGLKQHTGNWAGKTVSTAEGILETEKRTYRLVDLPGTYSLSAHSEEERIAGEYLSSKAADAVVVVCDATCLQRGLHLALQCIALNPNTILCVNLMDEARRKNIRWNLDAISEALGVPVVGVTARRKKTLQPLLAALDHLVLQPFIPKKPEDPRTLAALANQIQSKADCSIPSHKQSEHRLDHFLIGTLPGLFIMILMLALLLWVTILSADRVSDWLSIILSPIGNVFRIMLSGAPWWLKGIIIDGVWRVLRWVVSVMLPPMAIFFPLFTILEDAGFLPRIAFALDRPFHVCGACGKQSLTCCMGIGCNAAGVVGCRIIDSERERLLAVLTNAFMPCSGRFPMLAALCTMFFSSKKGNSAVAALCLTAVFVTAFAATFAATKLLSATVLKGKPSAFTLELPPFRPPQVGQVLVRSILDRTIFVLGRAAVVAAPAGALIWVLANVQCSGAPLLEILSRWLNPIGAVMGLDGVIFLSFLLGLPANEIVFPLIMMGYLSVGVLPEMGTMDQIHSLLILNGWTLETAVCSAIFTLMHWPCSTTMISIWKETNSLKWTAVSVLLPTASGAVLCIMIHLAFSLL